MNDVLHPLYFSILNGTHTNTTIPDDITVIYNSFVNNVLVVGFVILFLANIAALILYHVQLRRRLKGSFSIIDATLSSNNALFGTMMVYCAVYTVILFFVAMIGNADRLVSRIYVIVNSFQSLLKPLVITIFFIILYKWNEALKKPTSKGRFLVGFIIVISIIAILTGVILSCVSLFTSLSTSDDAEGIRKAFNTMNITFLVRNILSWPVILGQAIAFGVLVLMIRRKINYRDLGEFTHRPIDKKKFSIGSAILGIPILFYILWLLLEVLEAVLFFMKKPTHSISFALDLLNALTFIALDIILIVLFFSQDEVPGREPMGVLEMTVPDHVESPEE